MANTESGPLAAHGSPSARRLGHGATSPVVRNPKVTAALLVCAERLHRLRLEKGLRLADAAALSGLSEAHLSRIESAERWPSLPALLSLAAAYGADPAAFLKEERLADRVTFHSAGAIWQGQEDTGSGVMLKDGLQIDYNLKTRVAGTEAEAPAGKRRRLGSPEELIGMAFAGCFSMSLAEQLGAAGFGPQHIETGAEVRLSQSAEQIAISGIHLSCSARVAGVDDERFDEIAQITKKACVVARALAAVPVTLTTSLLHDADDHPDDGRPSKGDARSAAQLGNEGGRQ